MSDWKKPEAFFGAINFIALIVAACSFYFGSQASADVRIAKVEAQLEYRVLPALKRIEDKIDK